ncbi:hypothetical protein AAII07_20825 [Microvirga sp. 0TCS3.31]
MVGVLLVFLLSCDAGGSSRQSAKRSGDLAAPEDAASGETALELKREDPVRCPSGPMSSWVMHEPSAVSESVNDLPWMTPDVVVSRAGTATVAFASVDNVVRTADDPPAAGDPQDPAHGQQDPHAPTGGVHLGIDGSDVQTTMVQEFVRLVDNSGSSNEIVDLQLPGRFPGRGWSSSPAEVAEQELLYEAHLAVNASGAAVLMWLDSAYNLLAVYRDSAWATWTAPQLVPASADISPTFEVGIDDVGRVLVVGRYGGEHGVRAIRRSSAGKWGKVQELSGPGTEFYTMAVGAGGAAVALHGPLDFDGPASGSLFASRMSPAGHWRPPVRQWNRVAFDEAVGMDGKGRALIAAWNGADLMGRLSTPDGRWRDPFVLASDVSRTRKWGLAVAVAVNRRGAAVVGWGAQGRVAQVWARYKPFGHKSWTRPVRMTPTDDAPRLFRVAIGECGHVAFAWETSRDTQLRVLRASPRP